jgi:hypothetical protein
MKMRRGILWERRRIAPRPRDWTAGRVCGEDPAMNRAPTSATGAAVRVNGLLVLVAIVVVGLLAGAGFYRMKRGELDARVAAELAAAPTTPAERVALWLRLAGPQIHHRLAVVGRFSADMPWLVTHAIASGAEPPEIWGIDCSALPLELAHLEGLTVVVELPAPRRLGNAALGAELLERVPLFAPEVRPDGRARLGELALHLLEGMPRALERDVPGAALVVRVAEADLAPPR